jgi:ABC-type nitrate/sulfonate/bicarbonate transport system substrate-binding protein
MLIASVLVLSLAACSPAAEEEPMKEVTVLLDWVPNTNHTGLYAALEEGYFAEEGLDVEIIQPSEGGSADLIAAGQADFGISYQEQVTYARTGEANLPIVAIAAVIQHNTSGFASPAEKGIESPADFEGKKYGGWGSPVEEAMLRSMMEAEGADFEKLEMVNIGAMDFFSSVAEHVDFTWIYYGWDGVAAEQKGMDLNFILLQDFDENLDFYTPVIIASEDLLETDPELAKAFLRATSRGYNFAIENPETAVGHLLTHAPEIDETIALASQEYLAGEYARGVDRWGEMEASTWANYADWLYERELIAEPLDVEEAFTNEYLPE